MKTKITLVSILFLLGSLCLLAEKQLYNKGESAIHLKNGKLIVMPIVDISTRTMEVELKNQKTIHISKIWMLNFINRNWNYPTERSRLSKEKDSIFLKNGDVVYDNLVDFSSKRKVYEFKEHRPIHISKIKRIYFCCSALPDAYKKKVGVVPMRKRIKAVRGKKIIK